MVEKGIRGVICHFIHRYAKANNKYMKHYDKNKESSHIQYQDVNNLHGWASQELPVNNFEQIKDTSQFNELFEKVEKLVAYLHDKIEYVIYIKNLKQALIMN